MARKNGAVDATLPLPGVSRPVGRPRTGKAKTPAERMRAYRERRKAQQNEFPSRVTETESAGIEPASTEAQGRARP